MCNNSGWSHLRMTPRGDHMVFDLTDHSWTGQARLVPESSGQVHRTGCPPGPPVGNVQAGLTDLGLPGCQTSADTGASPYFPNSGVKELFCWRQSEWESTWECWLLMVVVTLAPDHGHSLPLFCKIDFYWSVADLKRTASFFSTAK